MFAGKYKCQANITIGPLRFHSGEIYELTNEQLKGSAYREFFSLVSFYVQADVKAVEPETVEPKSGFFKGKKKKAGRPLGAKNKAKK